MAEQPVEVGVLRAEAVGLQKEADPAPDLAVSNAPAHDGDAGTGCVQSHHHVAEIPLLRDAFHRDAGLGFTGTALHCDATNPTGATQLYESVGMQRDQYYLAWRAGLPVFGASRPRG